MIDGEVILGIIDNSRIFENVWNLNLKVFFVYSLVFGKGVDYEFVKKVVV